MECPECADTGKAVTSCTYCGQLFCTDCLYEHELTCEDNDEKE